MSLAGKRITLGVTGSIAAYKAVAVARLLIKAGARVRVVMTASAEKFVGSATFAGLTGEPVAAEMFGAEIGGERHVALAADSDAVLIVPATADILARLAFGRAGDLLTATVLCARCPVLVAPAMHPSMWEHPATTRNVATLAADARVEFLGPTDGEVASGEHGVGRMLEPEDIVARVAARFGARDLEGRHVVVTAGPTIEDIDPVRFVSNRSSGKMGFSLAEQAARRGARVTLVAGPVSLATPPGVHRIDVRSALDMRTSVRAALGSGLASADALLMCAAVGDYRPKVTQPVKLKRGKTGPLSLDLVENPDILRELGAARRGATPLLVGFAVETGTDAQIVRSAKAKLREKRVDVVVANHAAESMGRDDNRVVIVEARSVQALPVLPKRDVADRVLDWVAAALGKRIATRERGKRPRRKR